MFYSICISEDTAKSICENGSPAGSFIDAIPLSIQLVLYGIQDKGRECQPFQGSGFDLALETVRYFACRLHHDSHHTMSLI